MWGRGRQHPSKFPSRLDPKPDFSEPQSLPGCAGSGGSAPGSGSGSGAGRLPVSQLPSSVPRTGDTRQGVGMWGIRQIHQHPKTGRKKLGCDQTWRDSPGWDVVGPAGFAVGILGGWRWGDPPSLVHQHPKNWEGRAGMQWMQEGCSVIAPVGIWWVQLGLELGSWENGDCGDLFSPSTPKFGVEELRSACVKKDEPTGIRDLRGWR